MTNYILEGYITPDLALSNLRCSECNQPSDWSLVCDSCRPRLSAHRRKVMRAKWHDIIRLKSGTRNGTVVCFHCEEPYPWQSVTGDHFPYTVGRRKDLEFDIRNGVPSCARCNMSNARFRKKPGEFLSFFPQESK